MRETKDTEFKERVSDTFLKTVSAFANGSGGIIVFGIGDDGKKVGLANPIQTALDIENKVNDSISPRPSYSISIDEGAACVTLNVGEGPSKPYLYRSKAYVRRDSSSIEADSLELRRLVLEGANTTFDALESDCAQPLTFATLELKLTNALSIDAVTNDTLKTLGLMRPNGSYTNAGAIFADDNSVMGIDIARFGSSISHILDRERMDGKSILSQYDAAVSFFERYYTYEEVRGMRRWQRERLPEAAFREALANALVHRLWDVNARVKVELYDDRVEVASPGGLMRDLSKEEYLSGDISVLRNPLIANVFFRMGLIENFGTGIRRIREIYADTNVKPAFRINENSIVVVLPVTDRAFVPNEDEAAVLEAMPSASSASSTEIAARAGFGKDKTLRVLAGLIDTHTVEKTGTGRGVRYRKL